MNILKMKGIGVAIVALAAVFSSSSEVHGQGGEQRRPDLPASCEHLEVDANERVAFKVYAEGFQIYNWNGSAWTLSGPDAELFADTGGRGKVGTHYAGPRWESNSGSIVRGTSPVACTVDAGSIAWLRLAVAETSGNGIFKGVTSIQRVNTSGGKAPVTPGTAIGEEARVPYTTEYYFYKLQ